MRVYGPLNLPSELSVHASEMYAKNLYNLSSLLIEKGAFAPSGRTRSSGPPSS